MAQQVNLQINNRITNSRSANEILSLVKSRVSEFNIVNCATALHRLAKNFPTRSGTDFFFHFFPLFSSSITLDVIL